MSTLKSQALLATLAATVALSSAEEEFRFGGRAVEIGFQPRLIWEVPADAHPGLKDVVTIETDDSLTTSRKVEMKVRLLGASYQPYGADAPVNFQVKVGSGVWETVFHGTDGAIDPSAVVYSTILSAGTEVNFSGAGNLYGSIWTPSRNTLTENLGVIALKDGDSVPEYSPASSQEGVEDHVAGYIENGKISLGPRDVIYLMEIGQGVAGSAGFDMQDLVVVVTFDESIKSPPTEIASTTEASTNFQSEGSVSSK